MDPLLRLIDEIYQGALDPAAWERTVSAMTAYLRSPKGLLFTNLVSPAGGGFSFTTGVSQQAMQIWNDHYIPYDVWTAAAMAKGCFRENNVVLGEDLLPEHEFVQSKIYRELLHGEGVSKICTGIVFGLGHADLPLTVYGVYRGPRDEKYGDWERQQMKLLVPHLSRALGVMFRLRDSELKVAASLAALDGLASGVALLDAAGRVVHLNREAQRMVKAADGLAVTAGALRLVDPGAQAAAELAIASATRAEALEVSHFSDGIAVPRPSGRRSYVVQAAALHEANGFNAGFNAQTRQVRAILFLTDPERPLQLDASLLSRLYNLTPAEAKLAQRLCSGDSPSAAARHSGISEATVKTQLASIFEKTGSHRQAELVKLLVSLASTDV
jgi:DNA-binding CsgD family transcriptional regulator/PAS domain-containing protein